jgi:hypothetical protein
LIDLRYKNGRVDWFEGIDRQEFRRDIFVGIIEFDVFFDDIVA